VLELQDLACERAGRTLFRGLSAQLRPGQWLYAQGANGAGKTSLLRLVCGLLAPAQGRVLWQGEPVGAAREDFGRQLVYIGHAAALKDDLSAQENLMSASLLAGWEVSPREARAALGQAGLGGRERTPARALSQGQRRRISLARLALPSAQPLWVLDEPFNALDTAAGDWLTGLMQAQLARGGCVVLTSHQGLQLAERVEPVKVAL
jgi:heme exporter protein A